VSNLLENAVKYSPKPSRIEVGLHQRDGQVFIAVRDHGLGIPAHEQVEVFSKFYRGEQARTRGIRGTGIGLAMVDEIVKAHHGHVAVESEPGKGSTFTIVLQLQAPDSGLQAPAVRKPRSQARSLEPEARSLHEAPKPEARSLKPEA
jgi:signal transduction histidine kinase